MPLLQSRNDPSPSPGHGVVAFVHDNEFQIRAQAPHRADLPIIIVGKACYRGDQHVHWVRRLAAPSLEATDEERSRGVLAVGGEGHHRLVHEFVPVREPEHPTALTDNLPERKGGGGARLPSACRQAQNACWLGAVPPTGQGSESALLVLEQGIPLWLQVRAGNQPRPCSDQGLLRPLTSGRFCRGRQEEVLCIVRLFYVVPRVLVLVVIERFLLVRRHP